MKRGLFGMIALGVVVALVLTGIYFWNFFVLKEIRLCVGDAVDSGFACESRSDCIAALERNGADFSNIDKLPDSLRSDFDSFFEEAVYCDRTCFMRETRGADLQKMGLVELDSCLDDEEEFLIKIKGKDLTGIWGLIKENNN